MKLAGLIITLLGFLIAVFSLSLTDAVMGRLVIVVIGLVVSLIGIIGVMNRAHNANAIWRK